MTTRATPNQPNRVFTQIADLLAARIDAGEFREGERLPSERDLALDYQCSRTSVREAILLLQSRGLLGKEHKARARVTRPDSAGLLDLLSGAARSLVESVEGIANLQEARALFECGLARHAARHATPKQIERLSLALGENRRSIGDAQAFTRTDMAFHLAIAEIPNNPLFVSLHHALGQWLVEQRTTGMLIQGSMRVVYRDHEAIFDAIAAHDVEAAEKAMADHLANVARYFWKARSAV
ncbi:UNVERIFIED_ORG: DNA-binding FadR family transcriptional regulator [Paraburkholderia sediminicola]|nr:DNA-binding FadR family transcriptional regulator [Paraburkholderia sediminicola]